MAITIFWNSAGDIISPDDEQDGQVKPMMPEDPRVKETLNKMYGSVGKNKRKKSKKFLPRESCIASEAADRIMYYEDINKEAAMQIEAGKAIKYHSCDILVAKTIIGSPFTADKEYLLTVHKDINGMANYKLRTDHGNIISVTREFLDDCFEQITTREGIDEYTPTHNELKTTVDEDLVPFSTRFIMKRYLKIAETALANERFDEAMSIIK